MQNVSPEPLQALALLLPDENLQIERRWLQDCLAWIKSAPPESRSVRPRRLADDLCGDPAARERFQRLWVQAFAPQLYAEAGIAEATSLVREPTVRVKRRLLRGAATCHGPSSHGPRLDFWPRDC
jgi:hypothetical protein